MAGLLDFLSAPESQLGLGLLAAAGSGQKFGPGLLSAVQYADSQRKGDLQQKLLQAQMDNYQSEIEARKLAAVKDARQQAWIERLMGGSPTQGQGAGFVGAAGASGAAPGAGMPAAGGGGQGGGGILELARSLGIPEQAIQADMAFNGGKGIAAMIEKNGGRDMQVTNGYAYDKNRVGAGFMPSLSTSQDGKTSMVRIGPDGLPVVSAPQGALETFNNYQGVQASYKPIKIYNPETGRDEYTSEGAVVRGARGGAGGGQQDIRSSAYAGGSRASANQESIQILQMEMQQPGRTQAEKDAISREIGRLQFMPKGEGAAPASGNYAAGPSSAEAALSDAARARAVDTAKADVVRDTDNRSKVRNANDNLSNADRAIELLKLGPTGSVIGSLMDSGSAVFGRSTPGGKIAAQLDIVSANMVKNVPRFEGPQSNIDVEGYKSAAGRVADRSLPIDQRIAAAQEVKYFEQKALRQAGGQQTGGATGSWGGSPGGGKSGQVINFSDLK
ncbi:hypothetical protein Daci_1958 [Delftia acidovorans SPH-1]|uniref:Uncharacterized protein n=1 Tax=Delftia acidovorans (strain DSM 14801 / SPH-1) TaxID=398578 RepID=A9BYQ5_DELAS|nr:hypothetical protein [Delftia acidovorans]ABX34598.1 hypothetical protein Daci_1958 [Delftia acidovorans SPH-1]QPS76034.1 hypothetical protein I6G48_05620 [Delftia acidovorans]